jgi:hypothetical protein
MRLTVITILVIVIFACLLLAQAPIGFGPGTLSPGLIDVFDWYAATASGCVAGTGGMCVGVLPRGDTIYFTGWFADAHLLPITTGLPVVGTLNDFTSKTCSGNVMLIQLAEFNWAAMNANRIYEVNCMPSYGTAPAMQDAPSGWNGHCTSNDDGSKGCTWKSRAAFVRGGLLYLPVERQIPVGTASIHDATLIVSADGGKTWKNPYTVAQGGPAQADGDAPKCGAASGGAGNPCTDASYPGSIMWPALPLKLYAWQVVQYGQDGATPPAGIKDGCDPALYTCFMGDPLEGTIARVLNTDLPSLDVTKWQYYTCPAITDTYRCPGSLASSWTSTFADRTPAGPPIGTMWSLSVAYIKEFKSYLLSGADGGTVFATAPTIQGPWEVTADNTSVPWGFSAPMLGAGYTVVSSNPPHINLTVAADTPAHSSQTTPLFSRWDLVLGRTPMMSGGGKPMYNRISSNPAAITPLHSGIVISDSHAQGTIPRKDLVWAFDFYDHGGNTYLPDAVGLGTYGFHDIASGSAFLSPCTNSTCAWNSGQGVALQAYGASIGDGYGGRLTSMAHETSQTIAIGAAATTTAGLTPLSAPAAMQGNGTFTVVAVFRRNATAFDQVPIWLTGNYSGSNTMVSLSYPNFTGGPLELGWGASVNRWRYLSNFTLVQGNWYFIASTVQANGANPAGHMWVGNGGVLVDQIAGVTRTSTGGTPVQTPNVAAAPLTLGFDSAGATHSLYGSYAGLYVYCRALGQAEVGLVYRTLKANLAARGVALQ